ncbi:MAG: GDP-mannose 4,6-dehydratase [Dehalococcoidales bacterium]
MNLNNKSVLVTGGAGFIGSHLVDRLIDEKPANLVVVDNFFLGKEDNLNEAKQKYPRLKIYRQDAADFKTMKSLVKRQGIQVVFNLAVIPLPASIEKPRWVYEQNNDITLCFCELAREGCFETLIHFSSSEAYGTCQYSPMDESHPLVPTTPYGASKAASDLLVLSYIKTFNIDAAIIRPFNNYGPRQNEGSYAGVIPLTIKRILSGESPVIYGDGKQTRDYIFVTDTTEAAVQIYNHETTRGRIINIGSGSEITINKLLKTISQHMNYDKTIVYENERLGDVRRLIANIDLARDLIGFKPKTDFDNGLKLTIDWYRKNLKTG